MDSKWDQISVSKLVNSKIATDYQHFANFTKGSQWTHCTDIKGLKEF